LESWSFGETNAGTAAVGLGMGAGKVQMGDFHFVMRSNKASPKLFLACADGEHIKKAVLTCRKAGKDQQEYLKWMFSDLLVSSHQTGGAASSDVVPLDQISINFTEAQIEGGRHVGRRGHDQVQRVDPELGVAATTRGGRRRVHPGASSAWCQALRRTLPGLGGAV